MKTFSKFALSTATEGSGLGFGCMGISAFYGAAMEDAKALELLKNVYDSGCRHFDTAELYQMEGSKPNETILGEFFQTVPRDSYSVGTKYWPAQGPNVYEYDDVKKHLQASLERLQLECVDLYYAHRVLSVEGGIKFAKAAQKLKEEGLIKEIGLSEVSGKWLEEIVEKSGVQIDAVQQEWSLMTRTLEEDLVPACKKLDVTIVAYSPLSRNLLAKKQEIPKDATDFRANLPRYSKENIEANNKVVEKVQELGDKYSASAAQISLSWLFHKAKEFGVNVVPIPGTTKIKNAENNFGSVKIELTDQDCKDLEALTALVVGDRYATAFMGNNMSIESQK